jgi:hypothetical protein
MKKIDIFDDKEFQSLDLDEKQRITLNYFNDQIANKEFFELENDEQDRIKQNFSNAQIDNQLEDKSNYVDINNSNNTNIADIAANLNQNENIETTNEYDHLYKQPKHIDKEVETLEEQDSNIIDQVQSSLVKQSRESARFVSEFAKRGAESLEATSLADAITVPEPLTQEQSDVIAEYSKKNRIKDTKAMQEIRADWDKDDWKSAVGKSILELPSVLADSSGEIVQLMNLPSTIVAIGTRVSKFEDEYKKNNDNKTPDDSWYAEAIATQSTLLLAEKLALGVLGKTAISTTPKSLIGVAGGVTAGGIFEGTQEYGEAISEEHLTQKDGAKTLKDIASGEDAAFSAFMGAIAGTTLKGGAESIGVARGKYNKGNQVGQALEEEIESKEFDQETINKQLIKNAYNKYQDDKYVDVNNLGEEGTLTNKEKQSKVSKMRQAWLDAGLNKNGQEIEKTEDINPLDSEPEDFEHWVRKNRPIEGESPETKNENETKKIRPQKADYQSLINDMNIGDYVDKNNGKRKAQLKEVRQLRDELIEIIGNNEEIQSYPALTEALEKKDLFASWIIASDFMEKTKDIEKGNPKTEEIKSQSFEEFFAEDIETEMNEKIKRTEELWTQNFEDVKQNPLYDLVIQRAKERSAKDIQSPNKLVSKGGLIEDTEKIGGENSSFIVPNAYEKNYDADFVLTKGDVANIEKENITPEIESKVKKDIETFELDEKWQDDVSNFQLDQKREPINKVVSGFEQLEKDLFPAEYEADLIPKGYVNETITPDTNFNFEKEFLNKDIQEETSEPNMENNEPQDSLSLTDETLIYNNKKFKNNGNDIISEDGKERLTFLKKGALLNPTKKDTFVYQVKTEHNTWGEYIPVEIDKNIQNNKKQKIESKPTISKMKIVENKDIKKPPREYDKKIEEIKSHIETMDLDPEQKAYAKVYTGESDVYKIKSHDIETLQNYVHLEKGDFRKGARKIVMKHYGNDKSSLTTNELFEMMDIISVGKVEFKQDRKGNPTKRREYTAYRGGVRYRAIIDEDRVNGNDFVLSYYTNRRKEAGNHNDVPSTPFTRENIITEEYKKSQEEKEENKILYSKGIDSPGYNYVQNHASAALPLRPESGEINFWKEKIVLPDFTQPVTTETLKLLIKGLTNNRLYKGRIKDKKTFGTYNTINTAVRVKNYDQVEVMAHEMAHYLDFKRGEKFKQFKESHKVFLNSVSYTSKRDLSLDEGFAEFVRLYTTNYKALDEKIQSNDIVKDFEKILSTDKKLLEDVKLFRIEAHKYYYQGVEAIMTSYSDDTISKNAKKVQNKLANRGAKFRQDYIDKSHSAKIVERTLKKDGVDSEATNSAYKKFRLIAGAGGTTETIYENGVPTVNKDGSLNDVKEDKNRKGLDEIFKPVFNKGNNEVKMMENYFKAKRALELHSQDREHKIPKQVALDIVQNIENKNSQNKYFKNVFNDYQEFNNQILDFYVAMKLITEEQKETFQENNKDYVPFFRIKESIAQGKVVEDKATPTLGKRLLGGTSTMSGIMNNIYGAVEKNVQDAYIARAKSQLFQDINDMKGAEFAVQVGLEDKITKASLEQQANHIATIMKKMGIAISKDGDILQNIEDSTYSLERIKLNLINNPKTLEFWSLSKPVSQENLIDSAIINIKGKDEKVYFEVKDPLIAEMIQSQKGIYIGDDPFGKALKGSIHFKNIKTAFITNNPLFYTTNAVRDTVTAGVQSESGFIPFYHTLIGMVHYMKKDKAYREFMVNGGAYATRQTALGNYDDIANVQTGASVRQMGAIQKVLHSLVTYGSDLFEQGTRIQEFNLATKKGKSKLEAAYQGRDVTTDFANGGTNENARKMLSIMAFTKAGINSIDKLYRVFSDKEHSKKNLWLAGGTIATMSLVLWAMNKDDERYKKLTADQKSMYWHLPIDKLFPKEVLKIFGLPGVWKIPKPHQIGMLFANIPELVVDFTYNKIEPKYKLEPGELTDRIIFDIGFNTQVFSTPSIALGLVEIGLNEDWRGLPIETMGMHFKAKEDRYRSTTPDLYKALRNSILSPVQIHHLSNSIFGLTGRMLDDGMNKALWDKKEKGEQVFSTYNPVAYLLGRFGAKEVEARTKYDATFYNTYRKIVEISTKLREIKKTRDSKELYSFYQDKENKKLLKIKDRMNKNYKNLNKISKDIKNLMEGKSPFKKADTKEKMINKKYLEKHSILKREVKYINSILHK